MKNNTDTISEIIFTHCPSVYTKGNQASLLFHTLKKRVLSFRDQFLSGIATLGIGTVLLVTAYLFFTQLAEYGWQ
ncbi:MAG: hypothetical protein GY799_15040 [Desulfobulbaceae bacterium]|nr:hypothetical protein [Desulfobulbaceae bacterium]